MIEMDKEIDKKEIRFEPGIKLMSHPEFWQGNLLEGSTEQYWTGQHHTDESKQKISDGVKNAKSKKKEN